MDNAMKMDGLTKAKWESVLEGLSKVPLRFRKDSHKEAEEFIRGILSRTNNLAPDVVITPGQIHYAVNCSLCKKQIHIMDDYVFKALTGEHKHFDCLYRYGAGNVKDSGEETPGEKPKE